jgi:hypothetical protein
MAEEKPNIDKPRIDTSAPVTDAELKGRITLSIQKWHEGFNRYIDLAEKNEIGQSVSPEIFKRMKESSKTHLDWMINEIYEVAKDRKIETKKDGETVIDSAPPGYAYIDKESKRVYEDYKKKIEKDIAAEPIAGLGSPMLERQIESAYKAINKELPKPGILSAMGSAFFDRDKGGFQWGGIGGALVGLIGGVLLGGGAEGGVLGIAMMLIGVFAGAWLGNYISDAYAAKKEHEKGEGQDKTRDKELDRGQGQVVKKNVSTPIKEEKKGNEGTELPAKEGLTAGQQNKEPQKTATSGQPFEDNSLDGYVNSPEYKAQRAKEQADELKKSSGGNGVTLTPPDASLIPTQAIGEVAIVTRQR